MVRGPRDENVLSTGVRSPIRPCNVNLLRRIPRPIDICPYKPLVWSWIGHGFPARVNFGSTHPQVGFVF